MANNSYIYNYDELKKMHRKNNDKINQRIRTLITLPPLFIVALARFHNLKPLPTIIIICFFILYTFLIADYIRQKNNLNFYTVVENCRNIGAIDYFSSQNVNTSNLEEAENNFLLTANEDFNWSETYKLGRIIASPNFVYIAGEYFGMDKPYIIPKEMIRQISYFNQIRGRFLSVRFILNNENIVYGDTRISAKYLSDNRSENEIITFQQNTNLYETKLNLKDN